MIKEYDSKVFENMSSLVINEREIKKELDTNPFAKYLLYIEKNCIIAYLYYSEIYDRIEINQLEVEKNHRNCGIATKLLKELTDSVDKDITLEVKVDNDPAIALYNKFDFEKKAIRKGYYKGIDGILMERKSK